jgi:hypothetical protein
MKKAPPSAIFPFFSLFVGLFCIISIPVQAQSYHDSTERKNVVRFDLTALAFYNNAFNVSYERVIKKNQSLVLTIGSQQLKGIGSRISNEDVEAGDTKASGYKIAGEYRFYLGKENELLLEINNKTNELILTFEKF